MKYFILAPIIDAVASRERFFDVFSDNKVSALALITANILPLFGVLFLDWDTFSIVLLYWAENVIIGFVNVLKMIVVNPDVNSVDWAQLDSDEETAESQTSMDFSFLARKTKIVNQASKLVLIPFFVLHYGFFCLVHGFFVLALFGRDQIRDNLFDPLRVFERVLSQHDLWWCVTALGASHLCSFFVNYLSQREYQLTAVLLLMTQPYTRIVVLHFAIILGGLVALALRSNTGVLVALIIGKTFLDLSLHLGERDRNSSLARRATIAPSVIATAAEGSLPTHPASER